MTQTTDANRLPTVFIPHGGGPWPFVDFGVPWSELEGLANYLKGMPAVLTRRPRALLVVSAHWEERVPTVMTHPAPPLLFDYYNFPPAAYELTWPAAGDPALAQRVRQLLTESGIDSAEAPDRGFDHGTFVPLKLSFPDADIPTVQLSLQTGLDPARHLEIGRALAPLRDEGVFIIGSGMSFHNMRSLRDPRLVAHGPPFDDWLQRTIRAAPADRDQRLTKWEQAPSARGAHPREEHLIPLMVVAGAAGDDQGRVAWSGTSMRWPLAAAHFG